MRAGALVAGCRAERGRAIRTRMAWCLAVALPACNFLAGIDEPGDRRSPEGGAAAPGDAGASEALPGDAGASEALPGDAGASEALPGDAGASEANEEKPDADGDGARGASALAPPRDAEAEKGYAADGDEVRDDDATSHDASRDGPANDVMGQTRDAGLATSTDPERSLDAGSDATDEWVTLQWSLDGPADVEVRATNTEGDSLTSSCASRACSLRVRQGTRVILTASLSSGVAIATWEGCDMSHDNVCRVTVLDGAAVSVAVKRGYTLTVANSGTGSGSVSAAAQDGTSVPACVVPCSVILPEGTATLTAMAGAGSEFDKWDDDTTAGSRAVLLSADRTVDAQFVWTPATLSTLKLWLDASRSISFNQSGTVVSWQDRSPTRADFAADVPEHRPDITFASASGTRAVRFSGAQVLQHGSAALDPGDNDFVVSVVAASRAPAGNPGTLWHRMQLGGALYPDQMALLFNRSARGDLSTPAVSAFINGCWKASGEVYGDAMGPQYSDGSLHVLTMRHVSFSSATSDGFSGNVSLRVDGEEVDSAVSRGFCTRSGMTALGARVTETCNGTCTQGFADYLVGDIAEVVYIVGATSDQDLGRIEQYLLSKYGPMTP